ncbi:MAG: septal ring lytic transglycosylase RlpA family protein [Alphaproteobacteria bacterium]
MRNFHLLKYLPVLLLLALTSCMTTPGDQQEFLMPPESGDAKDGKIQKSEEWYQSSGDGVYKVGKPYKVNGVWYFPAENLKYDEIGYGGVYSPDFDNQRTANGEIYRKDALTASHKTLPLPSIARVTNLVNNTSVIVRINDRGPFSNDRLIDVSEKAATLLEFSGSGPSRVRVEILPEESKKAAELLAYGKKNSGQPLIIPGANPPQEESKPVETVQPESTEPTASNDDASQDMTERKLSFVEVVEKAEERDQLPDAGNVPSREFLPGEDPILDPPQAEMPAQESEVASPDRLRALAGVLGTIPLSQSRQIVTESTTAQDSDSAASMAEESPKASSHASIPLTSMAGSKKGYFIQVGTFGIEKNAVNLSSKLSRLAPTSVVPVKNGVRTLNRVEAGPFATKADADKILLYLKQAMGLQDAKLFQR